MNNYFIHPIFLYHAAVDRMPSSRSMRGENPSSVFAKRLLHNQLPCFISLTLSPFNRAAFWFSFEYKTLKNETTFKSQIGMEKVTHLLLRALAMASPISRQVDTPSLVM